MKVHIDSEGLKQLAKTARQRGTEEAFIKLALEWADAATERIAELEGLLTVANAGNASHIETIADLNRQIASLERNQ